MSRLNELSEKEIRILAKSACNERLMGIEFCAVLKRVLELAKADKQTEDEPQPKVKVGDRVKTPEGMGTVCNMITEQQNKTWANIPKEAKELARNLYNTSHIPQYEAVLELLFGQHNLETDSIMSHGIKCGDIVRIKDKTLERTYYNLPYSMVDKPFFVEELELDCDNHFNDKATVVNGGLRLSVSTSNIEIY